MTVAIGISHRRGCPRLLIEDSARAAVFELPAELCAQTAEEPGFGLITAIIDVCEVAGKQVEVPIVVEITPGGSNGVASVESR